MSFPDLEFFPLLVPDSDLLPCLSFGGRPLFRLVCLPEVFGDDDLPLSSSSESSLLGLSSPSESECVGEPFSSKFCDDLLPDVAGDEPVAADLDVEPMDANEDILLRATPVGVLKVVNVVLSTSVPPVAFEGEDDAEVDDNLQTEKQKVKKSFS